jgi:hypothetical protein
LACRTAETQKYETLKTHKKGLIQQLFPSLLKQPAFRSAHQQSEQPGAVNLPPIAKLLPANQDP